MTAAAVAGGERLNRFLARRGVASRRGSDLLIADGRVTVDGRVAVVGTTVDPATAVVAVDGTVLGVAPPPLTLMLNKPPGVVCTRSDPQGRPTVIDLIDQPDRLFPVGRLDLDSRGLLLLTTDGELALRLTHPRHGVRKVYVVRTEPPATAEQVRLLAAGVMLEDGPAIAEEVRSLGGGRLEVVMAEGRRREVRRLCSAVGLRVVDLVRMRFGPLLLGDLRQGQARPVTPAELRALHATVALPPPVR